MKKALFISIAFICVLGSCTRPRPTEINSPDNTIKLAFYLNDSNQMAYHITVNDTPFIAPSILGFEARDGINLSEDFHITGTDFDSKDEIWTQPWGENKSIRNHYNEMAVHLTDIKETLLTLRFRVFNDGIGFRYEYQVPDADSLFITDELTSFNIAQDGTSWSIPASFDTYELLYRTQPISQIDNANTPMTFKTGNIYASIHEAALTDFPEMTLKNTGNCLLKSELAPWPDGVKARITGGTFQTPWRTIQIAPKAVGLINSGLILNLNEPCVLETTDWIRPMKYVGIWWGMHLGVESWVINDRHGATTENAKRYIDFAAANHIDVHEPIKDTGIRRTYPNMMTREGARGMEWNAWSTGNPPSHHELLPFTRLLSGPMDYTPGIFDILYERVKHSPFRKKWNSMDSKDCRVNTTLAKQIANWVVIYSPLQMAADMIENYEGHPAFQFFRDFDADCDWSEALAGEPGEFVVIVRKAKDKYFLGATTNEEARTTDIKLDFLEKGKTYKATIYADGANADWETNPTSYEILEKTVTTDDTLSIRMAKGGGQAITFIPLEK